jgi:hypothetical protein
LILITFFCEKYTILFTSIFAVVVIGTVSLQKVIMDSRNNKLEIHKVNYESETKKMKEEYEKDIEELLKNIKKLKEEKNTLINKIEKKD